MPSGVANQEMVKLGAAFFPVHQAPNLPLKWSSDMDSALDKWTSRVKKSVELKGLGLKLFVDVLALTSPDIVIQLNSSNPTLNFPAITTEFSALETGWLYNTEPVTDEKEKAKQPRKHELVTVDSLVNNRTDHVPNRLIWAALNASVVALCHADLSGVNTLLKGAINIPDQIFLKQSNLDEVPYVDALAPAMALAPLKPRSRMPRKMGTAAS
nr:hypothetical protein BaRGS_006069 [Batillaria attramentaria]